MVDLLIHGGTVVDVERLLLIPADVLVSGDTISAVVPPGTATAPSTLDATDRFVAPGLIDSHLHIESTLLAPVEFARVAARRGTTAVFVDPHELANVVGVAAVELFLAQAADSIIDIAVGVPSCVPATGLEDAGGRVDTNDVTRLLSKDGVYGLAEMMNYPGIITGIGDSRAKVEHAFAAGLLVDGHAPEVSGADLRRYVSNGHDDGVVRIMTDHECTTAAEALEKHAAGMVVALRHGSASQDLERVLPDVLAAGVPLDRFVLASDDVDVRDLLADGHIDAIVRRAAAIFAERRGLEARAAVVHALRLATANAAAHFGRFYDRTRTPRPGAIAGGRLANIVLFEDLASLVVTDVLHRGKQVVRDGTVFSATPAPDYGPLLDTVHVRGPVTPDDFVVEALGKSAGTAHARVIGAEGGSLLTARLQRTVPVADGAVDVAAADDLCLLAVIERHRASGSKATALVSGLGLERGAVATTVAHDSHNLIVVGRDPDAMAAAANLVVEAGGGLAAIVGEESALLPLPLGGLMAVEDAESVDASYGRVLQLIRSTGTTVANVPMMLSFLALPVIPHLKLTNRGLVDVDAFDFVPVLI